MFTQDLDITPERSEKNLACVVAALKELDARLRTESDINGVAFPLDVAMLRTNDSWTLVTRSGDLDLVFLPAGTRGYADLVHDADELVVSKNPRLVVRVASLADVIRSKEAAGRDKDRAALPLLRRTLENPPK